VSYAYILILNCNFVHPWNGSYHWHDLSIWSKYARNPTHSRTCIYCMAQAIDEVYCKTNAHRSVNLWSNLPSFTCVAFKLNARSKLFAEITTTLTWVCGLSVSQMCVCHHLWLLERKNKVNKGPYILQSNILLQNSA